LTFGLGLLSLDGHLRFHLLDSEARSIGADRFGDLFRLLLLRLNERAIALLLRLNDSFIVVLLRLTGRIIVLLLSLTWLSLVLRGVLIRNATGFRTV
jgi:hypothetical protein